ncbi:MAG: hypothetical protein PVJ56_07005, partial [Desulfobacterales bacterium]
HADLLSCDIVTFEKIKVTFSRSSPVVNDSFMSLQIDTPASTMPGHHLLLVKDFFSVVFRHF